MIRDVTSPLTPESLLPLEGGIDLVRLGRPLTDAEYGALAELLREHPDVGLATWTHEFTDLDFLRFFPWIPTLRLRSYDLGSLAGLAHLDATCLHDLAIGETRKTLDLHVLERFGELRRLMLERHHRGVEVLGRLASLEDLQLRSMTLRDLSILIPLDRLRLLDLKLGGTKDLGLLPEIGQLEYLEIWMVRGLADISSVARLPHLRYLFLQAMRHVVALPATRDLGVLRGVRLETMKGLHDLAPLREAPVLEELFLVDMGHLTPADLEPLVDHPTLRGALLGLGSDRKNKAARDQTGLPELPYRRGSWRTSVR